MKTLTFEQWNKLIEQKKIVDLSDDLEPSMLYFGQVMRAKILLDGEIFLASAWSTGHVHLTELNDHRAPAQALAGRAGKVQKLP